MQQGMWDDKIIPVAPVPISWGYRRPVEGTPAERQAEARLAAKHRWNLDVIRGVQAATENGGSGAFRVVALASNTHESPTIKVLRMSAWKRFGNAVRQLRNVFLVAEAYSVSRIEFPSEHELFAGPATGPFQLAWAHSTEDQAEAEDRSVEAVALEGDFFTIAGLGLVPTPSDQARAISRYVRPLVRARILTPAEDVGDQDVVLHFRAGDVFRPGKNLHPGYGQPPLAYYLAAVARERPARVWIVFEDRSNPTVDAAEAVLRRQGYDVRMQSSALATDLGVLLNAACLVASFGSFCLAVAALSARLRTLYHLGAPVPTLQHLGITMVEGIDHIGHYRRAVTSNNWTASPEQQALMLSYPQQAIQFVEHPPLDKPGSL